MRICCLIYFSESEYWHLVRHKRLAETTTPSQSEGSTKSIIDTSTSSTKPATQVYNATEDNLSDETLVSDDDSEDNNTDVFIILPPYYTGDYYNLPDQQEIYDKPMSLQNASELLHLNTTRYFLNSIKDENMRLIVTEQLRYCPYTNLCNFSLNLHLHYSFDSPCEECVCERDAGGYPAPICANVLDYSLFNDLQYQEDLRACKAMFIKPPSDEHSEYKVIAGCINNFEGNTEHSHLCTAETMQQTFNDILPVTDTTSELTYLNKFCALCNNVDLDSVVFWEPMLKCDGRVDHNYQNEAELIKFAMETPGCNIEYSPPDYDLVEQCSTVIKSCNETGQWKEFNLFTAKACSFYDSLYTATDESMPGDGNGTAKYRFVLFQLCNHLSQEEIDWLQSLKQFFIDVSYHIHVASLILMALFKKKSHQS